MTNHRGQTTTGGSHRLSTSRSNNASDSEFDERDRAALIFALCCAASPLVVVGILVFGYMALAPLVGLPTVPAF